MRVEMLALTACSLVACGGPYGASRDADAERGASVIAAYGCGSCHEIPGIPGARGLVAPPLDSFARRTFIAGRFPNTRDNLVRWLLDPPSLVRETGMPKLGLSEADADAAAAYLYSLDGS